MAAAPRAVAAAVLEAAKAVRVAVMDTCITDEHVCHRWNGYRTSYSTDSCSEQRYVGYFPHTRQHILRLYSLNNPLEHKQDCSI